MGVRTQRKTIGSNWGGSSGIVIDNGSIILGGLDFSDRSGIKDEQTNYSIKDVSFLKSDDDWHFSKFKPLANQELTVRQWILLCSMRRNLANTTSIPGQIAWARLMF